MNLLDAIAIETGLSVSDIERIIRTAPARYKEFEIQKRSGGSRRIAQPSRELKLIQRFVLNKWLTRLPIHSSAMAYVAKKNIGHNAQAHRFSRAILKLDFQNFFPSIRVKDWRTFTKRHPSPWSDNGDANRIIKILFWGQKSNKPICLSIGAPTSPIISNLLLFHFDEMLSARARVDGLVYTRYADDISVSGATVESLVEFEKFVRLTIKAMTSPRLVMNEEKRGIFTLGRKRMVTGLVVTPQQAVSIGRERKRAISSMIHRFTINQLDIDRIGYLKGMIGFTLANEPQFISRMRIKYGNDVIDRILRTQLPKRLKQVDANHRE